MKWFAKKKKEEKSWPSFIVRGMLSLNKKLLLLSAWLQHKTHAYSKGRKMTILFFFCIAFSIESFYAIWNSFQKSTGHAYAVTPIRGMPLLKENGPSPTVGVPELGRVHRFKIYLDSLSLSASGRKRRDSLLTIRPHLLDTLRYLETLYNESYKK